MMIDLLFFDELVFFLQVRKMIRAVRIETLDPSLVCHVFLGNIQKRRPSRSAVGMSKGVICTVRRVRVA
jgi:hypothetical protein